MNERLPLMNRTAPILAVIGLTLAITPSALPAAQPTWHDDFAAGMRTAEAANRDVLVFFADEHTAATETALGDSLQTAGPGGKEVGDQFTLVEVPFPADPQQNPGRVYEHIALIQRFEIGQLPQIVLIDRHGRPYARFADVDNHVGAELATALERRNIRDTELAMAQASGGLERARHLHAALRQVGDLALPHYREEVEAILRADPENAAGLSGSYRADWNELHIDEVIQTQVFPLVDRQAFGAARERLQQLLEEVNPGKLHRQMLMGFIGQLQFNEGDHAEAIATIKAAIALAPDSPAARKLATTHATMLEAKATAP